VSDISIYRRIPPAECAALTLMDAAVYLGCGKSTVYNLAHDGKIRLVKVRGRTVAVRQSLDDYLQSQVKEPA
jgi:excisionase family DNA binding protein